MHHSIVPAIATYGYLNMPKEHLVDIPRTAVYCLSIVHNFGLHLFSLYHFIGFMSALWNRGIVAGRGIYFNIPGVDNMLWWFYLSKYYEYVDTALLYAKGKEPIFLQKFHHVGATIVWHLGYVYQFDGVFFASLINSGIHSVMYLYFLASMFPSIRQRIMRYKIYITSAQVAQLSFGFCALPWFYYNIETDRNRAIIWVFEIYIGILLVSFCHFMFVNYGGGSEKKEE